MAATNGRRNIFPLFDLPRELRDLIYADTLEDEAVELDCGLRLDVRDRAPLNLLMTSRQLKQELEEQATKKTVVQINDSLDVEPENPKTNSQFFMPSSIPRVQRLTVVLMQDDIDLIGLHRVWVFELLARFTSVSQLGIKFGIQEDYGIQNLGELPDELCKNGWTRLPGLFALQVFDARGPESAWDSTLWDTMVLQWTKETGHWEMLRAEGSAEV